MQQIERAGQARVEQRARGRERGRDRGDRERNAERERAGRRGRRDRRRAACRRSPRSTSPSSALSSRSAITRARQSRQRHEVRLGLAQRAARELALGVQQAGHRGSDSSSQVAPRGRRAAARARGTAASPPGCATRTGSRRSRRSRDRRSSGARAARGRDPAAASIAASSRVRSSAERPCWSGDGAGSACASASSDSRSNSRASRRRRRSASIAQCAAIASSQAPERARRVVARERGVRAREALLAHVLGLGVRAEQPPAQPLHVGPVVARELAERLAVARRARASSHCAGSALVANGRRSGPLHALGSNPNTGRDSTRSTPPPTRFYARIGAKNCARARCARRCAAWLGLACASAPGAGLPARARPTAAMRASRWRVAPGWPRIARRRCRRRAGPRPCGRARSTGWSRGTGSRPTASSRSLVTDRLGSAALGLGRRGCSRGPPRPTTSPRRSWCCAAAGAGSRAPRRASRARSRGGPGAIPDARLDRLARRLGQRIAEGL